MSQTSPKWSVRDALRDNAPPAADDNPKAKRTGDNLSDQILARLSVTDYLNGLGLEVPNSRKVTCPLPDCDDETPSFHVHREGGWKCYQCERGGTVIDLHLLAEGMNRKSGEDRRKAIHGLCDRLGIPYNDPDAFEPNLTDAPGDNGQAGDEHESDHQGGDEQPPPPPTSWAPVDLTDALAGHDVPPPTLWPRTDGLKLVYPGRVHWFIGESETFKSWVAQLIATDELKAGRAVLYIDLEDDDRGVIARLKALGAPADAIRERLVYIRPDEPLADRYGNPTAARRDLDAALEARDYTLCIIDGVTEAMTVEGLALLDNTDIARWLRLLPKRIAALGAAVVCIDHVAKTTETGNRYAIGGQHKLAGTTGAVYKFAAVRPLGRAVGPESVEGEVSVTVTKDRPGYVRGRTREGKVGAFIITAHPEGIVEAKLAPPGEARPDPELVAGILDYLATYDGSSKNAVENGVAGQAGRIRDTLRQLADDGLVRVEKKGNGHLHWLTDEGRQALDERDEEAPL